MKWLMVLFLAFCYPAESFGQWCETATCGQDSQSGNYGCVLGEFRGVIARSNGGWTGTGCGDYQCVTYVKDFYRVEVGDPIDVSWIVAANAWDTYDPSLLHLTNNGPDIPAPGDIICMDDGDAGHVLICTEAGSNYIKCIDQNRTDSSSNIILTLTMNVQNGHFTIPAWGDYLIEGWLRDPDYHPTSPVYLCELKSQSPTGIVDKHPGETFTCEVQYWNRGNTPWWNNAAQHSNDYVEEKSVYQNGNPNSDSFLYDASWLNSLSPCTFTDADHVVYPGEYAVFRFTGRVPEEASPGMHYAWFRLNHSTGGLLNDWGGLCFNINVVLPSPPTDPTPKPDAVIAIRMSATTEEFQGCPSTGSSFGSPSQLISDFGDDGNWYLFGDVNDDGFDDCLTGKVMNTGAVEWRLALSDGEGRLVSLGKVFDDFGDPTSVFLMGDFTGDGKCDLAGGTPEGSSTVKWRVARSNGTTLTSLGVWVNDFGNPGFRFFAGDVNDDGKCDLINNNDGTSNVTWRYATSTGHSFSGSTTGRNTPRSTPQKFQVGDYTGDGRCDIAFSTRTGTNVIRWYVCSITGSNTPPSWNNDIGNDNSQYFSQDMNFDGKCDLVAVTPVSGSMEWRVARSNGAKFLDTTVWKSSFGSSANLCFIANVFPTAQGRSAPDEPDIAAEDAARSGQALTNTSLTFRVAPNPSNGPTKLSFTVPAGEAASLEVFDLQGRLIRSLVNGQLPSDQATWWDGRNSSGQRVPAGIYFIRLSTSNGVATKRITVIR